MERRVILERAADAVAALNRGDAHGWVANMAEDVIWRDVALPLPANGRAAVRAAAEAYLEAIPDLRMEVTSATFEDPRLAHEWIATGTHLGTLMGVPATGRAVQTYGATIATFDEDGLMIEGTAYWNPLLIMRQLRLTRVDGSITAT